MKRIKRQKKRQKKKKRLKQPYFSFESTVFKKLGLLILMLPSVNLKPILFIYQHLDFSYAKSTQILKS